MIFSSVSFVNRILNSTSEKISEELTSRGREEG